MDVYKRREFARWQARECLPDHLLCRAVLEMHSGLVDASLGGLLFKKRIAGLCSGKRGGYRTLLSARIGDRYVFLHGFAKSDQANVTSAEQKALQFTGKVFLELSPRALAKALGCGVLMEVHCDQQTH
ncbi:type II toxin-antitoxin system RelE/ParE family toxin [Pseudomonas maumuensis]|uniref:Type II toxin-antitoxin system RelE/ParE family toxin n=1 Tax=Pseudomonas maumuensis TaxID=2842354 RepID=A0ABX8NDL3_9PSED|nr:type II toxin-antitoxin system RelE/ParE family toxin [Pseudomonas maumuensis]QXH54455.1 type II toxin-antitoxin system RelE/ParE family toxin [Pseudomonas maumuensis]